MRIAVGVMRLVFVVTQSHARIYLCNWRQFQQGEFACYQTSCLCLSRLITFQSDSFNSSFLGHRFLTLLQVMGPNGVPIVLEFDTGHRQYADSVAAIIKVGTATFVGL